MIHATHFKCACQHCGGHLECPIEASGSTVACPHCGKSTVLVALATTKHKSSLWKILVVIAALLLAVCAFVIINRKNAAQLKQQQDQAAEALRIAALKAEEAEIRAKDPFVQTGWRVGEVRIEKTPGGRIIHALGSLQNDTDRRRFGVKVTVQLLDAAGQPIGKASDYQASIEAHGLWQFSALVVNHNAVTAKVSDVEEAP